MSPDTTATRREFDDSTREELIAEIRRARAYGWKRDNEGADKLTAVAEQILADEQANADACGEHYRPSEQYLAGYRAAVKRHVEIVREVIW